MLIEKRLSKIAEITNSRQFGKDLSFKNVSIDSRSIKQGDLFVAIKGENFDGHDFIGQALEKGAVGIVSEKSLSKKLNYLKTKNNLDFLKILAQENRNMFRGQIVAITGSNGKTSTKEISYLLLSFLTDKKSVFKSPKNWNNELGLSLSLLGLNRKHKIGIFEIGTNRPGEIYSLSNFLKPDYGVITNIGRSHLENLKNLDGVAKEKSDLFINVKNKGVCLARTDNKYKKLISKKAIGKELKLLGNETKDIFDLNFEVAYLIVKEILNLERNSNVELSELKKRIQDNLKIPGRMEKINGPKKTTILNDSYNANPDSFLAAFEFISKLKYKHKILVMGEMGELGEKSDQLHDLVIQKATKHFDFIFCVDINSKIKSEKIKYLSKSDIVINLSRFFDKQTLILFKASRSVKMETLIDLI